MLDAPSFITTERLVLRQPRPCDAAAVFEYASDPLVVYYMDYPPRVTVNEVKEYLGGHQARWNAGNFSWILTIKPDDVAIGTIACSVDEHMADFGYLLNQNYWGEGYATEASHAIVEWAINLPTVYRVWATCDAENAASARVLEKCGLEREGRLRCYMVRPNISSEPRDAFLYARIRVDK